MSVPVEQTLHLLYSYYVEKRRRRGKFINTSLFKVSKPCNIATVGKDISVLAKLIEASPV